MVSSSTLTVKMEYTLKIFSFVCVILFIFYKWTTSQNKTFIKRKIKHKKPTFLVGNMGPQLSGKESSVSLFAKLHEEFKEEEIYGLYLFRNPFFVIRDPDLIKKIGIKDFEHFPNHEKNVAFHDEVFGNMLTVLQDQKWKDMRMTLSPVFTGSKMRQIFELLNESSFEAVNFLKEEEVKSEGSEVDIQEFFNRYVNDVIASAAFGLKVNSFKDKNNEFFLAGAKIVKFNFIAIVKSLIFTLFPKLSKLIKINIADVKSLNYLKAVLKDTLQLRHKNKVIRKDMIHILLEAKRTEQDSFSSSEKGAWSENEMIAQCLLFFFAGFQTVASTLSFAVHELMKNPDIQEKLYEEIAEMNKCLDGSPLTYDSLKSMKYLDMVLSESLRMWPPVPVTDRICSKPYTLINNESEIITKFETGDRILFSIIGSHYDKENFPDPFTFNPDRFHDENKEIIKPFTYIPFGVGPRSCIANRFALMECKAMLYFLTLNLRFTPGSKATLDILKETKGLPLKEKKLFFVNLIPR